MYSSANKVFQLHSHSQATFFLLDATYIGAGSYSPDSKMFCWVELQVYKINVTSRKLLLTCPSSPSSVLHQLSLAVLQTSPTFSVIFLKGLHTCYILETGKIF